ncbi:hypothetical protein RVS70_05400 [Virgibacillus sp. M23]|uniref:hypothetical protein n=1 Tax=Virgibacillus sp. M23 TaxID=3079030 RepID=UPI002A917D71|nr:hypothetical protein [Virgibacillus sp. M23]MDY7043637.1 hypothetical protein [Virgibacillus sp. M23]
MSFVKSKKIWSIFGVLLLIIIVYFVGSNSAKAQVDGEKVNYDKIIKKIESAEKELKDIQTDIKGEQEKLEDKKTEVEKALSAIEEKDKIKSKIDELTDELDAKKGEIGKLDDSISEKEKELSKLNAGIAEKDEEPIVLSAGQYIVGSDIDAGRYKAVPIGAGSNFVVYDVNGSAIVNTVLGSDKYDENEYIFFTEMSNVIQTEAKVKLIPVE